MLSTNFLSLHPELTLPPIFEFLLRVKVMGSNLGYLLKSFLLYTYLSAWCNNRSPPGLICNDFATVSQDICFETNLCRQSRANHNFSQILFFYNIIIPSLQCTSRFYDTTRMWDKVISKYALFPPLFVSSRLHFLIANSHRVTFWQITILANNRNLFFATIAKFYSLLFFSMLPQIRQLYINQLL
jgi:hypothetical protein